ncbi:MAG: methionine biosynthesis protein MetW [Pseudomonadota bacterium]
MRLREDQKIIADWIAPGSRVLDLGCGDGSLLKSLHQERHVTGYGIEIDGANIVECIRNGVNVIHSDLDAGLAEFDDQSFDYVIMTETLQATRYPNLLVDEMLRIGQEGIVTFPNMGHWSSRLQFMFGKMPVTEHLPDTWFETPNIHMCTIRDFEKLCSAQGVEILHRAALDTEHRASIRTRMLPNLLAELAIYRIRRIGTA